MNANGASPRKILVLGLGNPDRGDDGVGAIIARSLAGRLPLGIEIRSRGGDMLSLVEDWAGFDAVICVDAAAPVGAPGRIHRIDAMTGTLPRDLTPGSSHAFGLADAVELARVLRYAPQSIVVYAVEGRCFDAGVAVTPEVAAAAATVTEMVVAEVGRLQHDDTESHANA
jgi:hydrogenase maturation protease